MVVILSFFYILGLEIYLILITYNKYWIPNANVQHTKGNKPAMKTNPKTRSLAQYTCNFNTRVLFWWFPSFSLSSSRSIPSPHLRTSFPRAEEDARGWGEKRRRGGNASEPRKLEIAAKLHWQVACRVAKIIFAALSLRAVREGGDGGRKTGGVNNGERT